MTPNDVVMYATVWVLSQICRPQEPLSAGRVRVRTCCECYNKRGYIRTWYVYKILFFIFHSLFFREVGTSLVQAYRPKFIQHRKFTPFCSRQILISYLVSHITSCQIDHEHHVVDFVSHTWQFLVSFLVHTIRDRPCQLFSFMRYTDVCYFSLPVQAYRPKFIQHRRFTPFCSR